MKPATLNTTAKNPLMGHLPLLCALLVGFGLGRLGGTPFSKSDMPSVVAETTPSGRSPPATTAAISAALTTRRLEEAGPGWHAIHVYYGDREGLLEPHKIAEAGRFAENRFSQEGQDTYALELLKNKRNGFFVDLASNHAFRLSNTFLLEQKYDWDGLCIEPNWQYWNGLASLRKCKVIGAVGGNPGATEPIQFRFHPFKPFLGAFGGIVGDTFDNKPDTEKDKDILEERRYTVALEEILETFGAPKVIDYFSFDVEGAEELILGRFPFDKYTFLVMNVERPSATITQLLTDNGYTKLRTDKYGDTVWKHRSLE